MDETVPKKLDKKDVKSLIPRNDDSKKLTNKGITTVKKNVLSPDKNLLNQTLKDQLEDYQPSIVDKILTLAARGQPSAVKAFFELKQLSNDQSRHFAVKPLTIKPPQEIEKQGIITKFVKSAFYNPFPDNVLPSFYIDTEDNIPKVYTQCYTKDDLREGKGPHKSPYGYVNFVEKKQILWGHDFEEIFNVNQIRRKAFELHFLYDFLNQLSEAKRQLFEFVQRGHLDTKLSYETLLSNITKTFFLSYDEFIFQCLITDVAIEEAMVNELFKEGLRAHSDMDFNNDEYDIHPNASKIMSKKCACYWNMYSALKVEKYIWYTRYKKNLVAPFSDNKNEVNIKDDPYSHL